MGQDIMTTSTTNNKNDLKKIPQNEEENDDSVSVNSVDLEDIEMALGDTKNSSKRQVRSGSSEPSVRMEWIHIAAIVAGLVGIGSGVLAGMFTESTYDEDSTSDLSMNIIAARFFGFLSIGSFMAATPTLFCAATSYQHQRKRKYLPSARLSIIVMKEKGSEHEGLPDLMSWAWIMYLAGVLDVVLPAFRMTFWVYFATLFNVLPFLMMMIHAEAARKY